MNTKTNILSTVLVLSILLGLFVYSKVVTPAEELAVIRAWVISMTTELSGDVPDPFGENVLLSKTSSTCINGSKIPTGVPEVLAKSFIKANKNKTNPIKLSQLTDLIAVVPYKASKDYVEHTDWIDISNRDLLRISRVGFSENQALLCVQSKRGGLLVILESEEGQWKINESLPVWIS